MQASDGESQYRMCWFNTDKKRGQLRQLRPFFVCTFYLALLGSTAVALRAFYFRSAGFLRDKTTNPS